MDYIDLYSTTATYLASKAIKIGQKRQIRAITPFKVIQGHRSSTPKIYIFPLHKQNRREIFYSLIFTKIHT